MRILIIDQQLSSGPVSLGSRWIATSSSVYTCTVDWEGRSVRPGMALSSLLNFMGEVGWIGLEDKDETS